MFFWISEIAIICFIGLQNIHIGMTKLKPDTHHTTLHISTQLHCHVHQNGVMCMASWLKLAAHALHIFAWPSSTRLSWPSYLYLAQLLFAQFIMPTTQLTSPFWWGSNIGIETPLLASCAIAGAWLVKLLQPYDCRRLQSGKTNMLLFPDWGDMT